MKQVFGFTPHHTPAPSAPVVPYVAVFVTEAGAFRVTMRDVLGHISEIDLPPDHAFDLGLSIVKEFRPPD